MIRRSQALRAPKPPKDAPTRQQGRGRDVASRGVWQRNARPKRRYARPRQRYGAMIPANRQPATPVPKPKQDAGVKHRRAVTLCADASPNVTGAEARR